MWLEICLRHVNWRYYVSDMRLQILCLGPLLEIWPIVQFGRGGGDQPAPDDNAWIHCQPIRAEHSLQSHYWRKFRFNYKMHHLVLRCQSVIALRIFHSNDTHMSNFKLYSDTTVEANISNVSLYGYGKYRNITYHVTIFSGLKFISAENCDTAAIKESIHEPGDNWRRSIYAIRIALLFANWNMQQLAHL